MRSLFVCLAKLLGLLQVYWSLTYLTSVSAALKAMTRIPGAQGQGSAMYAVGLVVFVVASFGLAWVLMFKTQWLADRLRIIEQGAPVGLDAGATLRTGIALVGVFTSVEAIPELIKALSEWMTHAYSSNSLAHAMSRQMLWQTRYSELWTSVLPTAIQFVLGIFLMLKSNTVAKWITRETEQHVRQVSSEAAPSAPPDEPST
ncbi:hypothetical protein JCM30471_11220 [Desulfuromonas carbonis]